MNLVLYLGCILFLGSRNTEGATTPSEDECDSGWVYASNLGCFKFYDEEYNITWFDAEDVCEDAGAFVAELVTSDQENLVISLANLALQYSNTTTWFIGLFDYGHEGTWKWLHSGYAASYTNWATGKPDSTSGNSNDCAVINYENGSWKWEDINCQDTEFNGKYISPICQRAGTPSSTTWSPPTTEAMYRLELVGGNSSSGNVFALNSLDKYGPVCDDSWSNIDAGVVCRQLGYNNGTATCCSAFGSVSSIFSFDNVGCTGSESYLQECTYFTSDNCGSGEGAGVHCYF